jgi:hypothetical protein
LTQIDTAKVRHLQIDNQQIGHCIAILNHL